MANLEYLIDRFKLYWGRFHDVAEYRETENSLQLIVIDKDGRKYIFNAWNNSIRELLMSDQSMTEDQVSLEFMFRFEATLRDRGVTQKELSAMTGISEHTISKYMMGKGTPSLYNLDRICKALNCPADTFLYWNK